MRRSRLAVPALALLAACSKDPTQIIVVVDSDLAVPSELVAVRAVVRWTGEDAVADERFGLLGGQLSESRHSLPLSFGLGPGAALDGEVSVELHALRPGDGAHFVRRAVTRFRPNQTLLLPLFLARDCRSESCRAMETCTELGCRPAFVDPGTLQVVSPGGELELPVRADAGVPRDAGLDPDAAPDAGPGADAEVSPDALPAPDGGPDAGDAGSTEACGPASADGDSCGPEGLRCCGGACVDTEVTSTACGAACLDCGPNAVCRDGVCDCVAPFEDCDPFPGCEADLSSDRDHCDGCNKPCPNGTSCIAGDCRACTVAGDCPRDTLACTGDPECQEGVCTQPLLPGSCLIAGACFQNGALRPGNPCERCDAQAPQLWSPNPGASCSDGLSCTATDVCNNTGQCVGSGSPCPPVPSCAQADCTEDAGCSVVVRPGNCLIGGACVSAGGVNPQNPCQICDPMWNPTLWRPRPLNTACDDGRYCTAVDRCDANGACVGGGSPCPGNVPECGSWQCVETVDQCQVVPYDGWCFIDGVCVRAGVEEGGNACATCQPIVDPYAYSPIDDGIACGISNYCCDGVCVFSSDPTQACVGTCLLPCLPGQTCQCSGSVCTCCDVGQQCI